MADQIPGAPRAIPAPVMAALDAIAPGYGISGAVHPEDYIFWYISDQRTGEEPGAVAREYLQSGKDTGLFIKGVLDEHNIRQILGRRPAPDQPIRMLEFASGYGRVTRHVPVLMPDVAVTACDIHSQAVAFCRQIGFPAQVSSPVPEALQLEGTFDVIFAFSFFTHMPRSSWGRWLVALAGQLAPNGLLIFTAHGEVSQGLMGVSTLEPDGFFFHSASEQKDLDQAEYGNCVTTAEFVLAEVMKTRLKLIQFRQATAGHHDLWVLHNEVGAADYRLSEGTRVLARAERAEAELAAVHRSTSWRVTAPVRVLGRMAKGG